MNAYDVFIEPTTVTCCLGCNFISSTRKHLVVAKTSLLQIFEVIDSSKQDGDSRNYSLKLVVQNKLQGKITDIQAIRTIECPQLDYLLISTEKAKISCIKWDSTRHAIQTVSLHYYEHVLENAMFDELTRSQLIVDPNSKTLACLRHENLLVFLPFHSLNEEDDEEERQDMTQLNGGENEHDGRLVSDIAAKIANSNSLFEESLLLEVKSLDNSIAEIIDLQFLHNYRKPTIAVLSQQKRTWAGLLPCTKDNIQFSVLSLNLASRSATTILKLENLPYDLDRIYPVPGPVNGSLLVGCNDIIHVDGGGISRRLSLNLYSIDTCESSRGYTDQLQLELKLENCTFAKLPDQSKLLLVLRDGQKKCISFEMDGKTIKKMNIEELDYENLSQFTLKAPSGAALLDDNLLFISSRTDDAVLVEFAGKLQAHADQKEVVESKQNDDDDNLYEDADLTVSKNGSYKQTMEVIIHDKVVNNGPVSSFTIGHYSRERYITNLPNPDYDLKSIFAAGGYGDTGHINIVTPTVQPTIRTSLTFSQLNRLWTLSNKYLVTSDDPHNKSELFDITRSYSRLPAKQFIHNELTVAMHELNNGEFILQVTPKHVILFNNKFKKVMTLDEDLKEFSGVDIITSVFNDGFLMLFFSTGELMIYTINTYGKSFTRIPLPKLLNDSLITTGYITDSRLLNAVTKDITLLTNRGQKRKRYEDGSISTQSNRREIENKSKIFIVVTGDNRIVAFNRFHNEKCFQLNSADKFTDVLTLAFFDINAGEPDPVIKQVILNDLGEGVCKDEYLTILTVGGEIYVYKMFFDGENYKFIKENDTPITGAPFNAFAEGTSIERRMVYFSNVSGFTCILVTGIIPYFIVKANQSVVRIFKFSKIPVVSFVPFSDDKLQNALIYLDTKKNARIVEIPLNFNYDNRLPMRRVTLGETVKSITYHEGSHTFVLSTLREIPYDCVDFEGNPIVGLKPEKPREISYTGLIKLMSPMNWSIIDSIDLSENEVGLHIKSVPLDVGSSAKRFKNRKEFILVGSGKYTTEDLAANGAFKLLEIIDIIPEPGRPETNHKFKEFTHQDIRGAVTSLCDVTGRFLIAQGQKIIVRDIKDNTAVPVAFFDTSVYVTEAKSFGNFVLLGDTLKSVWLAGFDAEPFRMLMLGKDLHGFDVSCADFLVKDESLYIVVADSKGILNILQYNPEDPSSLNGQRLLHKASFNTNYTTSCMKSIPKFEQFNQTSLFDQQPFQAMASTIEGAFYVVFPVDELVYRTLYILQQQLIDKEYHPCGLNPKMNRMGVSNILEGAQRPVLDCELLRRYAKLNDDRKHILAQKIGSSAQSDLWKDLIEMENVLNNL